MIRLDAIENRVLGKISTILDESALSSVLAKLKTPKGGEVTIFGHFVWDPTVNDQEEIDLLLGNEWSPSIKDFMESTDLSPRFSVSNFEALLMMIAEHKENSIGRLNFFSHGNSATLGISGRIIPSIVIFDEYVDESKINSLAQKGVTITEKLGGKEVSITLDDVRKRFKKDAVFVLYACHGGVNLALLRALSRLLEVDVVGFEDEIIYCPPVQTNPPFKRKGTQIGINKKTGGCSQNKTTANWRELINDESAFKHTFVKLINPFE